MSKLQSVRKTRDTAERNLRLVPPPRLTRRPKRRRWKIGRTRRPKYDHNFALHAHEEVVVLAAVVEMGGEASVRSLDCHYPHRFHRRELWKTLNRLARKGKLTTKGERTRWFRGPTYPGVIFAVPPEPEIGGKHGR